MDRPAVLAAFDEQVRRSANSDAPDERVECDGNVVRSISEGDGWNGVRWSDLGPDNADEVIAAQVSRFARLGRPWEWKHYSYDQPQDLPGRLLAAGFVRRSAETLLVADIAGLSLDVPPPPGVHLRPVNDKLGIDALVSVHDQVFGQVFGVAHCEMGRSLLAAIAGRPATAAAVIALAGQTPVAAGRVEFRPGSDFASLWGGGTLPAWRGRGVFRSLVAYRARLAAAEGARFLQVDASAASRPILMRLGFVALATTTPFVHPGSR